VKDGRVHCSININTETGRLSARRPSLQNQPALEKDRYKIRQAFVASPGKSLIVADYGQVFILCEVKFYFLHSIFFALLETSDF
jgi:DNA polymerase-1